MGKKKHGKKKKAKNEKAVEHVEIHPVEPARASVKKVRVKVVVVGNRRVGKTSLLRRYTKNEFSENQPPTTQGLCVFYVIVMLEIYITCPPIVVCVEIIMSS